MNRETKIKAIYKIIKPTYPYKKILIWDILDYFEDNFFILEKANESDLTILWLFLNKRKPLEDQSDECVDYIYNLIK